MEYRRPIFQPFLSYDLIDEGGFINAGRIVEVMDWDSFHPITTELEQYIRQQRLEGRRVKRRAEQRRREELDDLLFELGSVEQEATSDTTSQTLPPSHRTAHVPLMGPGRPRVLAMALLKAFLLSPFYEVQQNAEAIYRALRRNPAYLEKCGFQRTSPPAARTLRQFDQAMRESGLWSRTRVLLVELNLDDGLIHPEPNVAVDTSRHDSFGSVGKPSKRPVTEPTPSASSDGAAESAEQGPAPGSQPTPPPTCDVTEIVAKSPGNRRPGVKDAMVVLPQIELPILALAMPGNEPDVHTLRPILEALKQSHPRLVEPLTGVLADGIYSSEANRQSVKDILPGAHLYTPVHAGNRKSRFVPDRGIGFINAHGQPHCIMGHPMGLLGKDEKKREFIWACPVYNPDCKVDGLECDKKERCCPRACQGRVHRVPAEKTPQIDWDHPQFSKSFKPIYNLRTAIERVFGRAKRVLPFERLYNRGRKAFQGYLDRMVIAFQLFARAACRLGHPELMRSIAGSGKTARAAARA